MGNILRKKNMNAAKLKKWLKQDKQEQKLFKHWLSRGSGGYWRDENNNSYDEEWIQNDILNKKFSDFDFEIVYQDREMNDNYEAVDYVWVIRSEKDFIKMKAYYDSYDG